MDTWEYTDERFAYDPSRVPLWVADAEAYLTIVLKDWGARGWEVIEVDGPHELEDDTYWNVRMKRLKRRAPTR